MIYFTKSDNNQKSMFVYGDYEVESPSEIQNPPLIGNEGEKYSKWVKHYTKENPWLVQVPQSYLTDNFNIYGLSSKFSHYALALKVIKGFDVDIDEKIRKEIKAETERLYALIHQRFLLTFSGALHLQHKHKEGVYGRCPRVACNHWHLLPIGLSPEYGKGKVKAYCSCCKEVYDVEDVDCDGAAFGPYCSTFFIQVMEREINTKKCTETNLSICGIRVEPSYELNRSGLIHPKD